MPTPVHRGITATHPKQSFRNKADAGRRRPISISIFPVPATRAATTDTTTPEEEKTPPAGSSPSSHGPTTLARAPKARFTIALSGIASTAVVPGPKTSTKTSTNTVPARVPTPPKIPSTTDPPSEEKRTPAAGSSPSPLGPGILASAHHTRPTIAMSDIALTVVEIRPKTSTTLTKTATTVHTCQAGQGGASPPYDVKRGNTTKNDGIDDAVNITQHEDAHVNGWVFHNHDKPDLLCGSDEIVVAPKRDERDGAVAPVAVVGRNEKKQEKQKTRMVCYSV